jgi:voltage-gated potassium channel Kch
VYWAFPSCLSVGGAAGGVCGPLHALYFSVVTMTTLGFGDVHANPASPAGQVLLMLQVLLGYVLLAALVVRLGILFTSEGPAGEFDEPSPPAALRRRLGALFRRLARAVFADLRHLWAHMAGAFRSR